MARADLEAVVTDTHPLVWYAADERRRLSPSARRVFERFEEGRCAVFVPAPVVLELWFLSLNGTIDVRPSFRRWWQRRQRASLVEVPLETQDILSASELDWAHRDPQDRLIVATSLRLEYPLLTADRAIQEWRGVEVVW